MTLNRILGTLWGVLAILMVGLQALSGGPSWCDSYYHPVECAKQQQTNDMLFLVWVGIFLVCAIGGWLPARKKKLSLVMVLFPAVVLLGLLLYQIFLMITK